MPAPYAGEVWAKAKHKLTQIEIDRLIDGGIVSIGWTPPVSINPPEASNPADDLHAHRYDFRLEFAKDGAWYIDGTGPGQNGWLPVEGPMWGPSPSEQAMAKLGVLLLAVCAPEGAA